MMFESRVFHTSKDLEFPKDYEDAFQVDEAIGRAAIADGVSSAIFSRQWADVLTRAVQVNPPDLNSEVDFKRWLAERRQEWLALIDVARLPWNQRQKMQQVGGAFTTLMWLQLLRCESSDTHPVNPADGLQLTCYSVGDCTLFHVRQRDVLLSFPLTTTAEFEVDPISICSVNLNRDHCLEFRVLNTTCQPGDLLVLCTDAVGKWAMSQIEAGTPPNWEAYWDMPPEVWLNEVIGLRQNRQMRYDDTTLVLLRVAGIRPVESTVHECGTLSLAAVSGSESSADELLCGETVEECAKSLPHRNDTQAIASTHTDSCGDIGNAEPVSPEAQLTETERV